MTVDAVRLVMVALAGIGLAVWLIAKLGLHPFIGLLCGAFAIGLGAGLAPQETVKAVEKGFGDILGGTGIVVALGLGLGTILHISGAAQVLADAALKRTGRRRADWGGLAAAMLLGLRVVLLMPVIVAGLASNRATGAERMRVMLSALAGLSALHALMPPHPGPLIAVTELHAGIGRTMLLGLAAAVPTAIIAGPVLARFTTRGIASEAPASVAPQTAALPPIGVALFVLLLPVALIATGAFRRLETGSASMGGWLAMLADPVAALLLANLVGLVLLFGRRVTDRALQASIWSEAMRPAAGILLSIGAGGALKQVLVLAGLADVLAQLAKAELVSPIIAAWLVAAAIRLATGSATVATITAAGVMSGLVTRSGVAPEWFVLAIGTGSVFFSHVNDPGFWLVRGYPGTSTRDTFRTWSTLETVISVVGLIAVLILHRLVG